MSTIVSTNSALSSLLPDFSSLGASKSEEAKQLQGIGSDTTTASGIPQSADQATVSQFGQLMSQLQQLSTTNQDAFKSTVQAISDNLAKSAESSTDSTQKATLSTLSAQFAEAAKSGDMTSLKNLDSDPTDTGVNASSGAANGDTVTISSGAQSLASQNSSSGSGASSDSDTSASKGKADTTASASSTAASTSSAAASTSSTTDSSASGSAGGGAKSGGTSNSGKTLDQIETEIDDVKRDIQKMQGKVDQGKQLAKGDGSKADEAKSKQTQLDSLNTQLAELQSEKVQAGG